MDWYEDARGTQGMQIIWRNPAPPGRNSTSKSRLLMLDTDVTIYVAGSPNVEAVFELILGGNLATAGEPRAGAVRGYWGRHPWSFLAPNSTSENYHNPHPHRPF